MLPRSNNHDRRLELDRRAVEAANAIRKGSSIGGSFLVVTHFDADGISAGSIVLAAITRLASQVHLRVIESISEKVLGELEAIDPDTIIFTDVGSGYLSPINKILGHKEIIIADHHQVLGEEPENCHHLNPHLLGYDGSSEISGSGTAYLLAKAIDYRNKDLAAVAVVGSLGDQQDKGARRTLQGLNDEILRDALEAGVVDVTQDLILFGRQTRPIHKAIASTTSPFLPGLSGEEDRCLALLDAVNIPTKIDDRWRTIVDLTTEEKRRLVDMIIHHIISLKISGQIALELIGSVYSLTREDPWTPLKDAREFATLLNACGRMGTPGLGIALGIGDRALAFEEAQRVYNEYRKSLAKYMNWLTSNPSILTQRPHLAIVRGEGVIEEGMTGAISSLVSSSNLFGDSKVTLVIASTSDGSAKVSARATDKLVAKGLNLGKILQEITPKYGGNGGGHSIAAGATLQRERLDKFLDELGRMVDSVVV